MMIQGINSWTLLTLLPFRRSQDTDIQGRRGPKVLADLFLWFWPIGEGADGNNNVTFGSHQNGPRSRSSTQLLKVNETATLLGRSLSSSISRTMSP